MELKEAILSACNLAPDLVWIDPVLFAEEWQEKKGLGGCFAGLAEQVLARRSRIEKTEEAAEKVAEESIRLALRNEVLRKENEKTEKLDMVLRCRKMAFPLMEWFQENARILRWRSEPRPYYVWISEIMLQQTRVEAVKGYFDRFIESLPDIQALAECPEEKLLKLWEGLGYYNRVRNLQKAARQIIEDYEGKLPDSYEKLQKLPGIGSYTAGAIASIAYGKPAPAVDGNVLRVLKRQALMELGATVCLPNGKPSCENCPVESLCRIAGTKEWQEIPVKPAKKSRKIEERTVFVISQGERVGLCKRPEKGLLAGLWELPNTERKLSPEEAGQFLEETLGIEAVELLSLGEAKHIFSHVEWRMVGYAVKVAEYAKVRSPIRMVTGQELEKEYSLPSAFEAYRPET